MKQMLSTRLVNFFFIKRNLLFLLLSAGCCSAGEDTVFGKAVIFDESGQSAAYKTSIITLLSDYQNLDNVLVQIEGYLSADWEGPIVFLTHEHCERYSSFNGVGIKLDENLTVDWTKLMNPDCRMVIIEGKYKFLPYRKLNEHTISLRTVQTILIDVNYIADISND